MLVIDHTSLFVMSTVIITGSATLRELDVSGNHNSDNWISLEGLQSNKTLARLNISECDLSVKGTVATIQDVLICLMISVSPTEM